MTVPIATSPGRVGLRAAAVALLRLRRGQRPVRLRLEPVAARDHPQDRQGPAAVPRRRGVGRLHPVGRRRPRAGARAERHAALRGHAPPRRRTTPIHRYRPRIEGLFARIERWTHQTPRATSTGARSPGTTSRRSTARTTTRASSIRPIRSRTARIFSWLICESYDDKGNAIVYEYAAEDATGVDRDAGPRAQPRARDGATATSSASGTATAPRRSIEPDLAPATTGSSRSCSTTARATTRTFELDLDYGRSTNSIGASGAGIERRAMAASARIRSRPTARASRCAPIGSASRVLMFHHFPELARRGADCLVRSTDFDYADLDYRRRRDRAELAHQGSTRFASFMRSSRSPATSVTTPGVIERNGVGTSPTSRSRCRRSSSSTARPRSRTRCTSSTPTASRTCPPASTARVPVGRPGRRRHLRDPHRAGRRLVLQAEPRRPVAFGAARDASPPSAVTRPRSGERTPAVPRPRRRRPARPGRARRPDARLLRAHDATRAGSRSARSVAAQHATGTTRTCGSST